MECKRSEQILLKAGYALKGRARFALKGRDLDG